MTTETRAPLTLTLEQLREESYASVLVPKPVWTAGGSMAELKTQRNCCRAFRKS